MSSSPKDIFDDLEELSHGIEQFIELVESIQRLSIDPECLELLLDAVGVNLR